MTYLYGFTKSDGTGYHWADGSCIKIYPSPPKVFCAMCTDENYRGFYNEEDAAKWLYDNGYGPAKCVPPLPVPIQALPIAPESEEDEWDELFREAEEEGDEVDMVNAPPHYNNGDIECIDAIQAALTTEEWRGFLKGQVMKYVWRERDKGGTEDLQKASYYLAKLNDIGLD